MEKYEQIVQKIVEGLKQRIEQLTEMKTKATMKDAKMSVEARADEVQRIYEAVLDIKLVVLTDEANKELDTEEKLTKMRKDMEHRIVELEKFKELASGIEEKIRWQMRIDEAKRALDRLWEKNLIEQEMKEKRIDALKEAAIQYDKSSKVCPTCKGIGKTYIGEEDDISDVDVICTDCDGSGIKKSR